MKLGRITAAILSFFFRSTSAGSWAKLVDSFWISFFISSILSLSKLSLFQYFVWSQRWQMSFILFICIFPIFYNTSGSCSVLSSRKSVWILNFYMIWLLGYCSSSILYSVFLLSVFSFFIFFILYFRNFGDDISVSIWHLGCWSILTLAVSSWRTLKVTKLLGIGIF